MKILNLKQIEDIAGNRYVFQRIGKAFYPLSLRTSQNLINLPYLPLASFKTVNFIYLGESLISNELFDIVYLNNLGKLNCNTRPLMKWRKERSYVHRTPR